MYQLYYSPGACSMAIHVLLDELHVPYRAINANQGDTKKRTPEFLKLSPRGAVPVLVEDGFVIKEGGAIINWLLDKHQSPMLPPVSKNNGKDRATALEWLMFANATMHPAYGRAFFIMKNVTDPATQDQLYKAAIGQINNLWKEVDAQLAKTQYVCGNDISAADILLTVIANWGGYFPVKIALGDNVQRMIRDVIKRPSYQKALAEEKEEYKAVA